MGHGKIFAIVSFCAFSLAACGLVGEEAAARKAVLSALKDPDSAKFGKFTLVDEKHACLNVNAKNSMGGYVGEGAVPLIRISSGEWISVGGNTPMSHDLCVEINRAEPLAQSNGADSKIEPARTTPSSLRVEFADQSWIEIRDATQKIIFVGEYKAGVREDLEGKPPFQVWIGRASSVRLFRSGRSIDLKPHTRDEVARFTLK